MGTVYLAHAPDGRPVAIKVIRPELARDPAFRARFAAEVDAARRVTASCTARVLDAEPAARPPWFVTEYVEGTPLDRLVAAGGPLPPSSVEGLAVGVAAALTAIHAAGSVTLNGMVLGTPAWGHPAAATLPAGATAPRWGTPPPEQGQASGWEAPPGRPEEGSGAAPRRRWYRRKRYLLPLLAAGLLLVAALNRGDDGGRSSSRGGSARSGTGQSPTTSATVRQRDPGVAGLRQPVRDGKLEFIVTSVSCGHATVGQPPLQFRTGGQFCLVRLQVRNISGQSWNLSPNQYLLDTVGDRHRIDLRGGLAVSSQRMLERLEPGQRISGTLVFDLPRGVRAARLELHDGLLSGGVSVRLSRN